MRSSTALASAALIAACSSATAPSSSGSLAGNPSSDDDGPPSASSPDASPGTPPGPDASAAPATVAPEPAWNDGTKCTGAADIETWKLDASTFVLRQSLCTHYEAPFMVLFVGDERALLVDSGTGDADVVAAVDAILAGKDVDLFVARSHAHGDHTGGEADLTSRPRTTLTGKPKTPTIDLGNRVLDVIPIPGHEASHVAYYDARTRVLLTGDTLYPGRLYVRDFAAYKASIARLVGFVDGGHPVSLLLGAHIELSKTGAEFKVGSQLHANEHPLSLAESDLRDLHTATQQMTSAVRVEGPRWVIVPVQ